MPHTVVYEPPLIRIAITETISAAVLSELMDDLERHEALLPATPDRLVDLTPVNGGSVTFPDILRLTEMRKKTTFKNNFRTAIVAVSPVSMGIARMFQTLNDHPQITTQTFTSLDAAEAWLANP